MKTFLVAVALMVSFPAWAEETFRSAWTAALLDNWERSGRDPTYDQDFFDCLVDETIATFTPAEMGRLDDFAANPNPDIEPEILRIIANRDKRIGVDIKDYINEKCRPLAN